MIRLFTLVKKFQVPLFILALFCVPLIVTNIYYLHLINLSLITIIVVIGLNTLTGYAGQASIGHAAFYGMGAYASAIMTTRLSVPFWIALPLSGIIAAILGYAVGRPTLRLRGAYLAIASIGIGEITQLIMINWISVTNGAQGIKGVQSPEVAGFKLNSDIRYFYLLAIVVSIVFILISRLIDSEVGRAFKAIREEEIAAEFMGVDIAKMKVVAFVISTFLAGIAGSLFAHLEGYVSPYGFGFMQSVGFLIMALAGGLGYKIGPVIGVLVIIFARESFRLFNEYQLVIYGVLLIVIIVFMPRGISGYLYNLAQRLRKRRGVMHVKQHLEN